MVDHSQPKKSNPSPPLFKAPQRPDELTRLETGLIDVSEIRGDATQGLFDALQAAKDKQAASNRPLITGVQEDEPGNFLSKLSSQTYLVLILIVILGLSSWGLVSILSRSGKQLDVTVENRQATQDGTRTQSGIAGQNTPPSQNLSQPSTDLRPSQSGNSATPGFDLEKERERIRLKERELELEREKSREREREREVERERERERELERERERDRDQAQPSEGATEQAPPEAAAAPEGEAPPPAEAPAAEASIQ